MTKSPLISVIVPSYNHAAYIAVAVQSIIDQDYPNLEIILIDDGSTDDTAVVAENALKRGGRPYRLVRQENAGAHAALNRGIQMAAGDYIAILNDDDWYLPGRLQALFTALSVSKRRFAYSKVLHVDRIGFPHPYQAHYLSQIEQARQFPTISFELLRNNIATSTGNFFFHRSLFDEVGEFAPYVTSHDWDYILRVLLVEEPLFVDETLLKYRIHAGGTLQKHLDLVNAETEQIMLNYLTRVGDAKNSLAPGPAQWGAVWNGFSEHYLERIRALPQVSERLDAMRFTEGKAPNSFSKPLPDVARFLIADEYWPDLDLTQITLDIPALVEEARSQPRLLILLPWMVMGGAERFVLNLIDQLQARGWQVSIACSAPSDNAWKDEFAARTDDILVLPEAVPIRDYPRYLRYFIELRRFDALLVQGSVEGYRLLPALRLLFPRLPILDYLHFVSPDWMDGGFPRLSCLYHDAIDLTITSCQQVKDWMFTQGINETRLQVCPIGVDPAVWKPDRAARERIRQEMSIRDDEVVLIYAARLEAQKQPLVFAETLHLLAGRGVAFRAIIAGDGSLRPELERVLSQHGLKERVSLLGAVKSEDMPALLAAGDVFFLPSQNEGVSAAVYEAMATCLPVVGADVGGQAELVTPDCGLLLPAMPDAGQPAAYADAVQVLIEDGARRQRTGAASRDRIVRGFTLDHMGEFMSTIFAETIRLKNAGELAPVELSCEQRNLRETRHVVEYLQARQEWRNKNNQNLNLMHQYTNLSDQYTNLSDQYTNLSDQYFDLLQPKPPSHWFYLWLRQIALAIIDRLKGSRLSQFTIIMQKRIKHIRDK